MSLAITASDFFPRDPNHMLSRFYENHSGTAYNTLRFEDGQVGFGYAGGNIKFPIPKGPTYDLNLDLVKSGYIRTTPYRPEGKWSDLTRGSQNFDLNDAERRAVLAPQLVPKSSRLNHCFHIQWEGDLAILPQVSGFEFPGSKKVVGFSGNQWYCYGWSTVYELDGSKHSEHIEAGNSTTWVLAHQPRIHADFSRSMWTKDVHAMPNHWYYSHLNSGNTQKIPGSSVLSQGIGFFPIGLWYCGRSLHCDDPWYHDTNLRDEAFIYAFITPNKDVPAYAEWTTKFRVIYCYVGKYSSSYSYLYSYTPSVRFNSPLAAYEYARNQGWHSLKKSNFSRGSAYVANSYYNTGTAQYEEHIQSNKAEYYSAVYDRFWDPHWTAEIDSAITACSQDALVGEKATTGNTSLLIEKSFGMGGVIDTYAHLFDYVGVKNRSDLARTVGILPSVIKSGTITTEDWLKAFGKEANNLFLSTYYGTRLFIRGWKNLLRSIPAVIRKIQSDYSYSHGQRVLNLDGKFPCEVKCVASQAYRYYDEGLIRYLGMLHDMDVLPSPRSLWDGVPYSFVVDWVFPIGDRLSVYDATASRLVLQQLRSCYSFHARIKLEPRQVAFSLPVKAMASSSFVGPPLTLSIYKREYQRSPINPLVHGSGLNLDEIDPSWNLKKTLVGGALLLQRGL